MSTAIQSIISMFTNYDTNRFCRNTNFVNISEDFSPKALVIVERLLELLGKGGVTS